MGWRPQWNGLETGSVGSCIGICGMGFGTYVVLCVCVCVCVCMCENVQIAHTHCITLSLLSEELGSSEWAGSVRG